jgi:hypothetical protein
MIDEPTETVVMNGRPRDRGTPEGDATRNDRKAERWWWPVADVDLRVHPLPAPRPLSRTLPGCAAAASRDARQPGLAGAVSEDGRLHP